MKSLSKFSIAFPWILLRSILRHIILLVPSLTATTPATARASDLALVVDYARVKSESIVLYCIVLYRIIVYIRSYTVQQGCQVVYLLGLILLQYHC